MSANKSLEYIEQAHQTASPNFYGHLVPKYHAVDVLNDAITALAKLDAIKKTLFYGSELNGIRSALGLDSLSGLPFQLADSCVPEDNENMRNLIHGVIGKATEAGELLEPLLSAILGHPFDVVNVKEETGDGFWYDALILRATGSDFETEQARNIAKLRKRYASKFTAYDATHRDLSAERQILEDMKGVDGLTGSIPGF